MKKRFVCFGFIMIFAVLLCSCGKNVVVHNMPRRKASTGESWTVMIYMSGSTMEESYGKAGETLMSMKYDLPENINVIVETGGSRKWSVNGMESREVSDYVVQKNGIRPVRTAASVSMGSGDTLAGFLQWGIKTYPAQRYMAVIWGHGGGAVGGNAYDSVYGFDSLEIPELKQAFESTGVKFDMIGFDTSLASNLETAVALSGCADYMTASEDIMPINGWDYAALFKKLSETPGSSPADIGQSVCDGVYNRADEEEKKTTAMAVTDLSKTAALAEAFEKTAAELNAALEAPDRYAGIVGAIRSGDALGGNSKIEGYSNTADLGALARAAAGEQSENGQGLYDALNDAVVYKKTSAYHVGLCGLGVYYPYNPRESELKKYRRISVSGAYTEYIEKCSVDISLRHRKEDPKLTAVWKENSLIDHSLLKAGRDIKGRYSLSIGEPHRFTGVGVNFYMYSKKDASYLYLYRDYDVSSDNGSYAYDFNGRLPMLNSTPIAMYRSGGNAEYDMYAVPVRFNDETVVMRVLHAKNVTGSGAYRILGLWEGVNKYTGMAERKYKMPETGDVITPLYPALGQEENKYIEGSKIRVGFGGLSITEKKINDGDYLVSFTVSDMYGNEYESDADSLISENGNVKID